MTLRERILSVYRRETPDVVPFMLDLSHWFYQKHGLPWDLSKVYMEPERELIDYHRSAGAGFYIANGACFYECQCRKDVKAGVAKSSDGGEIAWTYQTPVGTITRRRRWSEETYSWAISQWGVKTERDLETLGNALSGLEFAPRWDLYQAWVDYVGDLGVVYVSPGYSAVGQLMNYWLGIEGTIYASVDWRRTMHDVVDRINESCLRCVDMLAESPAEVVLMGDNFSSDYQPRSFFDEWSRPFYVEALRRLHAAGKYVAVHIDGRLRGALGMFRKLGADCADAVTPLPMGDLSAEECRDEAGPEMILSGGVSPDLWLPNADIERFKKAVIDWLDLRKRSIRLVANAGDQVPPGADEDRIRLMRDLVEKHGRC